MARWREQELDQDHRRRDRHLPKAISCTTQRSPEPITVSHLRFGPDPIRRHTSFTRRIRGCHQFSFLERYDVLELAEPEAVLPVERPLSARTRYGMSCRSRCRSRSSTSSCGFYVIDAYAVAKARHGRRINTVMQTCFFASRACCRAKRPSSRSSTRSRKPTASAATRSFRATSTAVERRSHICKGAVPRSHCAAPDAATVPAGAPDFVKRVTALMMARQGDLLPVCAFRSTAPGPRGTSQMGEAQHRR